MSFDYLASIPARGWFQIKFWWIWIFFHMNVKFCKPESSAAFLFLKLAPRWGDSYYIIVSTSGFDVLIECTDFMYVPIHSPNMRNIIYFWPLGALGQFLQLARSCHRITLIEPYPLSSTSQCTLPWGRDSHDLLRQQSGNVFLRSTLWWIIKVSAVFLDFLIFSSFNDFKMFLLWISIPWRQFVPRDGSRSNFDEYEYFFTRV